MSNKLTRTFGKVKLATIKHSPEILLVAGIASGVATVVFACKGTLKAEDVIDEHKSMIADIHEAKELASEEEYSAKDVQLDTVKAYSKTAWEMFKIYAPAIGFGALSLTCVLGSHGIMRKRNIALAASLATVRTAYDDYRKRVIRDLGKEMDDHFLYDTVDKVVETETVDDKSGKKKTIKETVKKSKYANAYSRIFDNCNCPDSFEKDGGSNYIFIRAQMLHLQRKLERDGFLFLNDVYKQLGFPITLAGQTAGWLYDPNDRENTMIFFEGFDVNEIANSQAVRDLMNGRENSIILNFLNIRDTILEDIPRIDSSVAAI